MANKKYKTEEERANAINSNNRKYWKTKKGKLMLTYNNMNRRVRGYVKKHIYKGLDILNRDLFYEWSINNEHFNSFHDYFTSKLPQTLADRTSR